VEKRMEKNKGQVSLEAIIIIGIIVLGSVVFATFYLSNINKKIDTTSNLPDVDLSNYFPGGGDGFDGIGGGSGGTTEPPVEGICGDGVINIGEQCENVSGNIVFASGYTGCVDVIGSHLGEVVQQDIVSCDSTCQVDYSQCVFGPILFNSFFLDLTPFPTASANVNQPYPTYLRVDFNSTEGEEQLVDVRLVVETFNPALQSNVFVDNCSYNNTQIPANEEGLFINTFSSLTPDEILNNNISCNQEGTFNFNFIGVDQNDSSLSDQKILEFTLPVQSPPEYALCSEESNSNGTVNLCVNRFSGTQTNSNGNVAFYVSHPDLAEYNSLNPVCVTNSNGELCLSLGLN
jgi:hypothetical protein